MLKLSNTCELEYVGDCWELRVFRVKGKSKNPNKIAVPGMACDKFWYGTCEQALLGAVDKTCLDTATCETFCQCLRQFEENIHNLCRNLETHEKRKD